MLASPLSLDSRPLPTDRFYVIVPPPLVEKRHSQNQHLRLPGRLAPRFVNGWQTLRALHHARTRHGYPFRQPFYEQRLSFSRFFVTFPTDHLVKTASFVFFTRFTFLLECVNRRSAIAVREVYVTSRTVMIVLRQQGESEERIH